MSYLKAEDILPKELIEAILRYSINRGEYYDQRIN